MAFFNTFFLFSRNCGLNSLEFFCLVRDYQLNLPDPATPIMFGIHNLHNHILFFLCLIIASVLFLLFSVLFFFSFYEDKYYGANYYFNFFVSACYFLSFYFFLIFLKIASSFKLYFKTLRTNDIFVVYAKLFTPFVFVYKVFFFSLIVLYSILFDLVQFLRFGFISLLERATASLYFSFVSFVNFFCKFFGLNFSLNVSLSNFTNDHFVLSQDSFFLKTKYSLLCLSSLFNVPIIISSVAYFFELVTLRRFSFLNGLSFNTFVNVNFTGINYSFLFSFKTLGLFCRWLFSYSWSYKIFISTLPIFASLKGLDCSGLRRQWLTYLLVNRQYRVTHNLNLEVIWTVIPTIILVFIAVPSFALLYSMDELLEPSITVKIVGHQWYWSYEYSDFRPLCNQVIKFDSYMVPDADLQFGDLRLLKTDCPLILPKETNIRFLITATDVLHSWAMPSFGIKMDAVPGRLNQTSTYVTEVGRYYGQCSELCGVNHAFMPIEICVVEPKDYYNWMFLKFAANG